MGAPRAPVLILIAAIAMLPSAGLRADGKMCAPDDTPYQETVYRW